MNPRENWAWMKRACFAKRARRWKKENSFWKFREPWKVPKQRTKLGGKQFNEILCRFNTPLCGNLCYYCFPLRLRFGFLCSGFLFDACWRRKIIAFECRLWNLFRMFFDLMSPRETIWQRWSVVRFNLQLFYGFLITTLSNRVHKNAKSSLTVSIPSMACLKRRQKWPNNENIAANFHTNYV